MSQSLATSAVIILTFSVAILSAALVGVAAGIVSRMGGSSITAAVLIGGKAFGATLTLALAVLAIATTWLRLPALTVSRHA
jgi:hypothetical protein